MVHSSKSPRLNKTTMSCTSLLMCETRTRLIFLTLTVIGQFSIPWSKLAANQNG
jgi:hypothetical protein